jgi:hypothetical protein
MLEKRINHSTAEQSDIEEKIKNLEGYANQPSPFC